jgi:hypothetical protein
VTAEYTSGVPALRTEITEIVTGLATLGHAEVGLALQHRPPQLVNVGDGAWDRVVAAWGERRYGQEFHAAWANGAHFLRTVLRRQVPLRVEWKGPHRPPGYERLPADLRIDHVYLVSCKYLSKILHNASPAALFDQGLAGGNGPAVDWYAEVAPDAYQALYESVRPSADLPPLVTELRRPDRAVLKGALAGGWPGDGADRYGELAAAVSAASAHRWKARLGRKAAREEMVWRLLRLQAAPYFVLGTSDAATLRVRVGTPWDWRQRFDLVDFEVAAEAGGQPRVGWRAVVHDREQAADRVAAGHVEIRWSHGRFAQAPEAKVYLDTPHRDVPGYFPLD